jgi:hypothetical protein
MVQKTTSDGILRKLYYGEHEYAATHWYRTTECVHARTKLTAVPRKASKLMAKAFAVRTGLPGWAAFTAAPRSRLAESWLLRWQYTYLLHWVTSLTAIITAAHSATAAARVRSIPAWRPEHAHRLASARASVYSVRAPGEFLPRLQRRRAGDFACEAKHHAAFTITRK